MAKGFTEKRSDPKYIADMGNNQANWGGSLWILGFIFAILGIITDAIGTTGDYTTLFSCTTGNARIGYVQTGQSQGF